MTKKFDQISSDTFDCLAAKLKAQGLEMAGDSGYLSKNGISLDYAFDKEAQTLTIENLEVGFPATMIGMNTDKVLGILDKAIADCRG